MPITPVRIDVNEDLSINFDNWDSVNGKDEMIIGIESQMSGTQVEVYKHEILPLILTLMKIADITIEMIIQGEQNA